MNENKRIKGVIKLSNPIKSYDGTELPELEYDADEITIELYRKYVAEAGNADMLFHLLGAAAVNAVNPKLDRTDINRLRGSDLNKLKNIGAEYVRNSAEYEITEDAGTIELTNPIVTPSGEEISVLRYDNNAMTLDAYLAALEGTNAGFEESVSVGFASILAAEKLEKSVLNRIKGNDCMKVSKIGANFIRTADE